VRSKRQRKDEWVDSLRVFFRRAARIEFEDAAIWYENQRPGLGEEFVLEVEQILAGAVAAPMRFPVVAQDVRRAVTRRFPYAIYFRVRADTLVVIAVFHGRRNPLIWHRRS